MPEEPAIVFQRARNAEGTPQIVNKDDIVGEVRFDAFNGEKFASTASIAVKVDGAPKGGQNWHISRIQDVC